MFKCCYLLLMLIINKPPAWSFWSASAELLKMRHCSAWCRGIFCNWLQESFVKMLAEHVLCPLSSISLMVHLHLRRVEVSPGKGWFFVLQATTLLPIFVIKGLYCICVAKQWKLGSRDWLMITDSITSSLVERRADNFIGTDYEIHCPSFYTN